MAFVLIADYDMHPIAVGYLNIFGHHGVVSEINLLLVYPARNAFSSAFGIMAYL
ncbi:hypothetical protein D3C72_1787400 [compost metagenome]